MKQLQVEGPGGRQLEVELDGPHDGPVVMLHTGTPGAGNLFEPLVEAGADRGLRHLSYSRPGYAGSDRNPGRSVADCTRDVAAIADHVGLDQFYVAGLSGGGPHALACAALLGDRVAAAATIGGVAPWRAEGLDWLDGMGDENIEEFGAVQAGEEQLIAFLERFRPGLVQAKGPDLHAALGDLLSDVDRRALSGEFAEYMAESCRRGLAPGIWGWFDDDLAFFRDWGFDLGAIDCPVSIWQGQQDRFVPYAHGEWLASHVSGARPHLYPEHGHLSLAIGSYGEILDDLMA